MTIFDELREKLKAFYARYDVYILPVLKFALAMVVFIGINNMLGYLSFLNNLAAVAVLALISAFLPLNGMVVISIFQIVLHCFGAGIGVGAFALVLYLVMALLYFRFVPGDGAALMLTPLAFAVHMPAAVPLALGLIKGPVSAISAALSTVSWYFILMVNSMNASGILSDSPLDALQSMASGLTENQELFLAVIAAALVVLVVSTIRKALLYFCLGDRCRGRKCRVSSGDGFGGAFYAAGYCRAAAGGRDGGRCCYFTDSGVFRLSCRLCPKPVSSV